MMNRRKFSVMAGGAALAAQDKARPNILWLTCEDTSPHIGAYGDAYANTPNLDKLANRSLLYRTCWSNAPVCAPARTTIISGMYPPSTGSEHMRSNTHLPPNMRMYPQYLREAGYYVTNNAKEDYNLDKPGKVWDDSSGKAHWRNRPQGQPFFSIFNYLITHESQLRTRPHKWIHDPAKVRVPAYHPDLPEVRQDWAQSYDNISTMDGLVGKALADLESDGLANDTIVFFYGDHGSGMPRSKRWPFNIGLQVPLLVHIPEKFRHLAPPDYRAGGQTDRMVGFVDLAPTLLSLVGMKPPAWMQGTAFLGEHIGREQEFLHGFRGRMDERYDMVRSVRDKRYVYVRNYMPHRIYGQHIAYMFETPTTRVWKEQYDKGKLNDAQKKFWEEKPAEELYDLQSDRDEVNNLAASPAHEQILAKLRKAQQEHARRIRDVGFLPEDEIHSRSEGSSPYEMGHDPKKYPMERIVAAAELASSRKAGVNAKLIAALKDSDSAVRFWGATGLLIRGKDAVAEARDPMLAAMRKDTAPSVRIVTAEAIGKHGDETQQQEAIRVLLGLADCVKNPYYAAVRALGALDSLGAKVKPMIDQIRALPATNPAITNPGLTIFPKALLDKILAKVG